MLYLQCGDWMASTVLNCGSLEAALHIMPGTKIVRQVLFLQFILRVTCFSLTQGSIALVDYNTECRKNVSTVLDSA